MGEGIKINTRTWSYLTTLIIPGVTNFRLSSSQEDWWYILTIVCNTCFANVFQNFLNNISFYKYHSIVWTNYTCETNQRMLTTIKTWTHCLLYNIKIASNCNHRTAIERKLLISFALSSLEREIMIPPSILIQNSKKGGIMKTRAEQSYYVRKLSIGWILNSKKRK